MAEQSNQPAALGHAAAGDASHEDALLKAVLDDVPLPAGLAERLKARVRAQYVDALDAGARGNNALDNNALSDNFASALAQPNMQAESPETASAVVPSSILTESVGDEQTGGWLRRSILVAALAASICGFAYVAREWTRPAEPTWLAAQCDLILAKIEEDNPANWQRIGEPMPAALRRVQSQLVRLKAVAERPLAALGSKMSGAVYRLDAGDGRGIYLMRLESLPAVRGLTSRFEILPTPSGGWTLVAMTDGKETFVLAAACTEQQIFAYIRRADLT